MSEIEEPTLNITTRLDFLAESNRRLTEAIAGVEARAEMIEKQNRQGRIIKWLIGSLILDTCLTIAFGVGAVNINQNSHQIGDIQTRVSDEVLCPLYEIFLASIAEPPEKPRTPEEQKQFDAAVTTINNGYAALDCARVQ